MQHIHYKQSYKLPYSPSYPEIITILLAEMLIIKLAINILWPI